MKDSTLQQWTEKAAQFSLAGAGVSRFFLTDEHRQLLDYLTLLMQGAGLEVSLDDAGNLVGRKVAANSDKVLYLGSHQDTVPHGGAYDGILGGLLPLLVLQDLKDVVLPFNVELIVFGDEEGTRFNSTLVGSSAIAGCFDQRILSAKDENNISIKEALTDFGLQAENIPAIARDKKQALGFIEVHIEQGPVLEQQHLPVGVVTAITGIERHEVTIGGKAGHAGTVPIDLRLDALVAASQYVSWLDQYCWQQQDIIGVVGKLNVAPNSVNVIPSQVELTVELRSPYEENRLKARLALEVLNEKLRQDGFTIQSDLVYSKEGVICDESLCQQLEKAIQKNDLPAMRLFSGAGHDGLAMTHLCPVGMLFLRCRDGLSHHPDEAIDYEDAEIARQILKDFILEFQYS